MNTYVKDIRDSMVNGFDKISKTLSFDILSPNDKIESFFAEKVQPKITSNTNEYFDRYPNITFNCTQQGFIPVVGRW